MTTTPEEIAKLGPLGALAGVWEGVKGADLAPSDDRGTEENLFRERMTFTPIGLVDNHEQELYGLRYATMAWRLGVDDPFHEEVGYWLWDAERELVMRCFIVPRGVTVLAGGSAAADATSFEMTAEAGSDIFGICSNPFLDVEFKTVRYTLSLAFEGPDAFRYEEDSVLRMKGRAELFHHTDANTMHRVEAV